MNNNLNTKKVYIVLTQTGTILSKIIKACTGAEYQHASISLNESLTQMYSFGRIFASNPFYGGYVKESPNYGTFKRFYKTKALVLEFNIDESSYLKMKNYLEEMYLKRKEFSYNYLGLIGALFKKKRAKPNKFYCSEFVNYIFLKYKVYDGKILPDIVKPIDFFNAFKNKTVFKGLLSSYANV